MTYFASCHCGSVRIAVPHLPSEVTACNCSYCARTGGLWAYYEVDEVRELTTDGKATYAPNILNEHHFCARCGMTTHGTSPKWSLADAENHTVPQTRSASINVRMLEDVDFTTLSVVTIDGRTLW